MKLVNYIQYQGLNKKNIDSINLTFKIIQSISMGIQKKFQKGEIYEKVSATYLKSGFFDILIPNISQFINFVELPALIKSIEFCSITNDGFELVSSQVSNVIYIIYLCYKHSDENISTVDLLYPASTVLLDLTANDQLIDQLSVDLKKWDIFNFIINKMLPKLTCMRYPDC